MKHLNNLGVKYYIVGATDRKTAEFLSGQVCARGLSRLVSECPEKSCGRWEADPIRPMTLRETTLVSSFSRRVLRPT